MDSDTGTRALPRVSFLIRRSRDQRLVSVSPGLIAAAHVLRRLSVPRHPSCALVLLIRRTPVLQCRYGVFKVHANADARPTRDAPSPSSVSQNSTAYARSRCAAKAACRLASSVDVVPGEPSGRTDDDSSIDGFGACRPEKPASLERR